VILYGVRIRKVISATVCTAVYYLEHWPVLDGRSLFKGELIHAQQFKKPSKFKGKAVVVLGIGNNAADIATALVGHASKIYLAHRGGTNLAGFPSPTWISG
jgi:dimethylaniline monooxygenase (N-oxide forming)